MCSSETCIYNREYNIAIQNSNSALISKTLKNIQSAEYKENKGHQHSLGKKKSHYISPNNVFNNISNQVPPQIDDNLLDEIILSFAYVVMYV